MHKDLTVTIVVYNDTEAAEMAVRSIEEQTAVSVSKEIFIVDNGAAEFGEKREKFRSFLAGYEDVRYVPAEKNIGYGAANNLVLPELDSDYHAIVNPDILLREDAFSLLIAFMNAHPACGMAVPKLLDQEGNIQKAYRRELTVSDLLIRYLFPKAFKKRQEKHTMQDMDYSEPFRVPFAQGSFLLIRTPLFKELKGFDERFFLYMEDADLCRRVNQVSELLYCPDASAVHGWERGSYHNRKLFKMHLRSMFRYFCKWGWKIA